MTLAIAVLLGGAFAAGRWSVSGAPESAERATTVVRDRLVTAPHTGVTAAEMRAAIREELAARAPTASHDTTPQASEPTAAPEPSASFPPANALIDTAIGRGRWTVDDGHRLRTLVAQLSRDEARALLSRIARAVNEQRLAIEAEDGAVM